jgi:cytochrome c oxidase subunit III
MMRGAGARGGHNGRVTAATTSRTPVAVNRPNVVATGTIIWLGSEVMFFAGLFAVYFTLRSTSPELWAEQAGKLDFTYALVNTLILVASSFTCQWGVFAAERLQARRTGTALQFWKWGTVEWFYLTFGLGAVFIVGQVYEYANLVSEHIGLSSDAYGSVFYLATGFHGLHVTGGLIAFLLVIGRIFAVKHFTHKEATTAIVVSYYWHFVDVVWIGLFIVIYALR